MQFNSIQFRVFMFWGDRPTTTSTFGSTLSLTSVIIFPNLSVSNGIITGMGSDMF